jgi:uncharacterized protein YhbP (UPF0306 family)
MAGPSTTDQTTALPAQIAAVLDRHHVMSLAVLCPDGPHAANVFYARDGFALHWVSDPSTRHSVAVEADARVAATIAMDYSDFPEIQGLQIWGRACRLVDEAPRARARLGLEARYPFLRLTADAPKALREAYDRAQFYRLEPSRIVHIDNTRGLGFKQTLELAQT